MKQIMLLRHAKSSWKNPLLEDHDRALNGRGRDAASEVGLEMARLNLLPDIVLCSTARRASETLAHLVPSLGDLNSIYFERFIYTAEAEALLSRLQRIPVKHKRVLLIGHNPSLEDLALIIAQDLNSAAGRLLSEKYPTAGLAVFEIEGSWKTLKPKSAELLEFMTPRSLEVKSE